MFYRSVGNFVQWILSVPPFCRALTLLFWHTTALNRRSALHFAANTGWLRKTRPLYFRACKFRSIHQIGTKSITNQRYFILNVTSYIIRNHL